MQSFKIGFLDNNEVVKQVTIRAFNKLEAYIKAEELYRIKGWTFNYTDLYGEMFFG